jgi:deazaflavin-dependent oxidoreductase (nitroreductase family)
MPNVRWLLALITSLHRALYLATRGWIGQRSFRYRFLLLGCFGRKTGREYVIPLLYVKDAGRYVVVGSNAGDARDPAWWTNLRVRPEGWVQVGSARRGVRAREATADEAEKLWPRLIEAYGQFEGYRARAGRPIPLVLLEPA